jgi:hypothetical protein
MTPTWAMPAGRRVGLIGLLVSWAMLTCLALLVPLGSGVPIFGGGIEAQRMGCDNAVASSTADPPNVPVPDSAASPTRGGTAFVAMERASLCHSRASGRIALVVTSTALLASVLILEAERRRRRGAVPFEPVAAQVANEPAVRPH